MLRDMTATQLDDWREFFDRHPFGAARDNHYAAQDAAMFFNAHRSKSTSPLELEDFLLMSRRQAELRKFKKTTNWMRGLSEAMRDTVSKGKKMAKKFARMRQRVDP